MSRLGKFGQHVSIEIPMYLRISSSASSYISTVISGGIPALAGGDLDLLPRGIFIGGITSMMVLPGAVISLTEPRNAVCMSCIAVVWQKANQAM